MKRTILAIVLCTLVLISCAPVQLPQSTKPIATGVDPNTWVKIPAGAFLKGIHNQPAQIEKPYEIMVTLVTNEQYAAYLNGAVKKGTIKLSGTTLVGYYPGEPYQGVKHEEKVAAGDWLHMTINAPGSHIKYENQVFTAFPGYENHPVVMVSWFGAKAYCESVGGRLPFEDEWEKAARGTDDRAYPWGDTLERNQANYYGSRDAFEALLGKQGDTTPVGYYNGKSYDGYQTLAAVSPYGLYDMAGNVWQWTNDDYEGVHYRYLRGGSKADYGYNLRVWSRNNVRPDYTSPSIGFRCVRDVK